MLLSPPTEFYAREPDRPPRAGLGTEARIWLVRHGRVDASDSAYGDTDVPLSEEGLRQTQEVEAAVRGNLAPTLVLSSPLQRARAMGEAIARATGAELRLDDRLREMNRGQWQGLSRQEYARRWRLEAKNYWSDPLGWRAHGGMSEGMLVEEAFPALEEVAQACRGGTGVIAAHRQVIRALVAAALGLPPGQSHSLRLDPGHAVLLADTGDRWSLVRSNIFIPGAPQLTEPDSGPPEDVPTRRS